jgi:hypothetical protein
LPGIRDVSKIAAGTYKPEPNHTQVLFTLNHLGFTDYTGQFLQPLGLDQEPFKGTLFQQASEPAFKEALRVADCRLGAL